MPEDRALTLKTPLQNEVESTLNRLPANVAKVFVFFLFLIVDMVYVSKPLFFHDAYFRP